MLDRLDGLVGVSHGLLEIYLRAGRGRRDRSSVVYSLPPADDPAQAVAGAAIRARWGLEGREAVLYVGKLSLGKGGPVFLRAAARVAETRPRTVFLVAGPDRPGPMPPPVEVLWVGPLSHEDMLAAYAAVDLVALPSVGPEAFSRVPLEAAMAGRPTVGARAGGIPEEIVDGETGLLVNRNDSEALALAILRLLEDRELRGRLGSNARRFVTKQFAPDAIATSLVASYRAARA